MKIKLNCKLKNHKAGDVITIKDNKGIPLEQYWRRRLKDSKIDNCIEIVQENVQKSYKKKEDKE